MKIEKLACCMARPMNAIRDLAAKVNELITAHNDHLENHPSGGGSVDPSPSPGGDSGVMVCNAICQFNEDLTSVTGTIDKTNGEIADAHLSGKIVQLRVNLPDMGMCMFMTPGFGSEDASTIAWQGIIETMIVGIIPNGDGTVAGSVLKLQTL